ncbi:MAG: c-type cytochrome biogenesis protein CcmI, partial [Pseudomonadota bacterium]
PVGEAPADGTEQGAMRGPTAADVQAAQSLSEEDRAAMIQGMVDGLSARLDDNPRDPAGWVRLLRARAVLGQEEAAANDIERLRAAFSDEPERVEAILVETGWSDE